MAWEKVFAPLPSHMWSSSVCYAYVFMCVCVRDGFMYFEQIFSAVWSSIYSIKTNWSCY